MRMTHLLSRALAFALLALLTWLIASTITVIAISGLPQQGEDMAAYQANALGAARHVDMIIGALVMLVFGWLVARPFHGREALKAASLFVLIYIAIEVGSAVLLMGTRPVDLSGSLLAYALKAAAGLIGGYLAGRSGGEATPDRS
jgi:hypothetical protein